MNRHQMELTLDADPVPERASSGLQCAAFEAPRRDRDNESGGGGEAAGEAGAEGLNPMLSTPRTATLAARSRPSVGRRGRRLVVARWWFNRMRDVVQSAREWHAAPAPWGAPEQVQLPLTTPPTRLNRRPPTQAVTA